MNPQSPFQPIQPAGQAPAPAPAPTAGYNPIPALTPPPMQRKQSKLWLILSIVFIFTTLAGAGLARWSGPADQ